jgi:hypothetical protein
MSEKSPLDHHYGWVPQLPDQRDELYAYRAPRLAVANLPSSVDLIVPGLPVLNQGQIGSCGPNSSAQDLHFNDTSLPFPSRLYIYYNTRVLMGTVNQDSGVDNRSMMKALAQWGWCDETQWPYETSRYTVRPPQACYTQGATRKIAEYSAVPQNLDQMKACLAGGDPFIFGFTVYESFETPEVSRTGLVPMPKKSERVLGGHDVWMVGYDDATGRMKFRNSWGEWGLQGCGYFPYAYTTDPNLSRDFWTVPSSKGPPPSPSPGPAGTRITYSGGLAVGDTGTYVVEG